MSDYSDLDQLYIRLNKIGIKLKLGSNAPWIYIDEINGKRVTERYNSDHGFTIAMMPIKNGGKVKLSPTSVIMDLIRKYTNGNNSKNK